MVKNKKTIRTKLKKHKRTRKIPGDHKLRFYRDAKSGHPFMSVSKSKDIYFGHEMTKHPSLTEMGQPRASYVLFYRNPNPYCRESSYFHKSIRRIKNGIINNVDRLKRKPLWRISRRDLKKVRNIDKKKIKNVRPVDD